VELEVITDEIEVGNETKEVLFLTILRNGEIEVELEPSDSNWLMRIWKRGEEQNCLIN